MSENQTIYIYRIVTRVPVRAGTRGDLTHHVVQLQIVVLMGPEIVHHEPEDDHLTGAVWGSDIGSKK